ncbi:ADP-ribose pyrophosphatase YjhB, NUDIX family [Alkalibacterium putridalgicola]|uniref:ADP-ribose pyrophosphatase YjhB, NUDIX family n=1 Tax=Alkalibacterium putridalgicola TaxID=426703 RepID=A0A1H7WRG6_9LACT|nr:NUDIX hydrolase [Alkalibacterium putridalgicola]GEK89650.1 DNA mismatch repair protein MutT [Alkalibacterium putridalgicola]SEM24041.1 ADP-ribose pyrophosphatase YjhB, NUDIX family [Alkalibacterium putridalgicola]
MDYVQGLREKIGHDTVILNGSVAFILNHEGEVLLQQRPDKSWELPGGLMELGESFEETLIREVKEETNLTVKGYHFVDILSGKDFFVSLANGDKYYSVTAPYHVTDFEGILNADSQESMQLQYFSMKNIPENINVRWRQFLNTFIEYYSNKK